MAGSGEERNPEEEERVQTTKKDVKASVEWTCPKRASRRRRPTERYGIDVVMRVEKSKKKPTL